MVPGLLRAHLAGDGEAIVLAVLVVALDIEMSEVDGDSERKESRSGLIIYSSLVQLETLHTALICVSGMIRGQTSNRLVGQVFSSDFRWKVYWSRYSIGQQYRSYFFEMCAYINTFSTFIMFK